MQCEINGRWKVQPSTLTTTSVKKTSIVRRHFNILDLDQTASSYPRYQDRTLMRQSASRLISGVIVAHTDKLVTPRVLERGTSVWTGEAAQENMCFGSLGLLIAGHLLNSLNLSPSVITTMYGTGE